MQTFDVSANILNDKLLFSSAGARSAARAKKDTVVQAACPEIEPAAVHDRCVISKFHVALFVGIILASGCQTSGFGKLSNTFWYCGSDMTSMLGPVYGMPMSIVALLKADTSYSDHRMIRASLPPQ